MATPTSARELRAAIAANRRKYWQVAAGAGMHPATLSGYLNERKPLTPAIAERIRRGIGDDGGPAAA
jgi:hypothetical protein